MLKDRLPTWREAFFIFAVVAFPIHIWVIVAILREIPSWILRLSLWDVVGVISYPLALALFETVLVTAVLLLLTMFLPQQWRQKKRVSIASLIILVVSIWFVILHYNSVIIDKRQFALLAAWGGSMLALMAAGVWLMLRSPKAERFLQKTVQQLAVLSVAYLLLDLLSIIFIVIRNV